jgi:hypothetical protein
MHKMALMEKWGISPNLTQFHQSPPCPTRNALDASRDARIAWP